jgi:ParB-like chromosome segregation protein Spo0J
MTTEYIETRMVPLEELTPYPGNARVGDRDKLVESLEANGQYRSLVVRQKDDELIILAGNNTMAALEAKGESAARCEIIHCDDATALRVNLVDNKSNDQATYDQEARAALLRLLDGEVSGSGYGEDEVDGILAQYEEEETTAYQEPEEAAYNDSAEEREARTVSHGGHDSQTFESRGVRDIFLALPSAQADELGRLIMALRETWGALPQGEVILKACRVAQDVAQAHKDNRAEAPRPDELMDAADAVFDAEAEDADA